MKQLEKEFVGTGEVRGFKFTRVEEGLQAYIYKVDTGVSIHYEVFEKKENTRFNCISYPKAQAFGNWAWTTPNIKIAQERYAKIEGLPW